MRLFILGATGKTGVQLVDLALARGHAVTAFVRSPQKISRRDEKLTVVTGDVFSADALARALEGHDAVLSALGPRPRQALTGTTLLRETAARSVEAMARAGAARLLIVSSAMLFPFNSLPFVLSRLILRPHYRDLLAMEEVVRASPLEWTIARPPRLIPRREERFVASEGAVPLHSSVLAWRALAAFLLDAAESGRYRRQVVGVSR